MSWEPQTKKDSQVAWQGNALRFATEAEARGWIEALQRRWGAEDVRVRAAESDEPVNARLAVGGNVVPVREAIADDPGGAWKQGDLADDLGWESPHVPVRSLKLHTTGEVLGISDLSAWGGTR